MKTSIKVLCAALLFISACSKYKKTSEGIEYKVFRTSDTAREVAKGDMVLLQMLGEIKSKDGQKDTVLFDSYKTAKPFYIPADEPNLKSVFTMLKKGDSAEFLINVDTLFGKSFGQGRPKNVPQGAFVTFTVSIVDVR